MAETQSMMLQRGEKRPSQQQATHEVCKRRAPYAPRACDACRRRKGRCDGRRPCEHCAGRSLECRYSSPGNGDDRRSNASASGPTLGSGSGNTGTVNQQQAQLQFLEQLRNQCLDTGPGPMSSADNNALTSLGSLVFSLQDQLATLTSFIKNQNPTSDVGSKQDTQATPPSHSQGSRTAFDALPAQSVEPPTCADAAGSVPTANSALKRSSCPFYGPTSPEYSFNAARITMSRDQHPSSTSRQRQPPSLSDELSDNDDDDDQCSTLVNDNDKLSPTDKMTGMSPFRLSPGLLLFSNVLSKKEAGRLLGVYQEIIGSLHPICDIQRMAKQLDRWYGWSLINDAGRTAGPLTRDELVREADELLVLGLALAIALSAESVSRSGLARELYDGFREAAMAKTFSPVPTERDVSITLMLGFYEYFNGRLQPAWRMCGLAGRMAMELGMHSREISQQMESEGRYSELATLTCSLLILDRQWSAAAGLPSNFQVTDFDSAQPGATQNPYLKAMMQFTLMSHKFNEPISRVAQGESCQDDDAFEITVCHIEQWRRKTLDNQDFSHALVWQKAPSTRPPSWTTMLYLRANAVRAIILRPFFLSSPASIACKKIKPALELITDSVTTLSILDSMTDTYRKQHPQFQHFLASSCSLLALVIAFEDQHHTELNNNADFPSDFATTVRQIYEKSLELSATYRELSCASRKLWKRLISMKSRVDNLSRSGNSQESGSTNGASNAETNGQAAYKNNAGGSIMGSGLGLGDNMLPITGNASRFVSDNDISTSQLMGMNGETLKEAGQSRPTSTQPNSGVALQTHFDDSRYMNWTAVSKTTAPARDNMGLCMTDVVDITGDEFAASNQDLAEWFSFDWPICDGTTFFSEAGL